MPRSANQQFREGFSKRFQSLMKRSGIHPEIGLAKTADTFQVSISTLKKWLHADALPEANRWEYICSILQCSMDDLFSESSRYYSPVGFSECSIIESIDCGNLKTRRVLIEDGGRDEYLSGNLLFTVTDNVMEPFVMCGDIVITNPRLLKPGGSSMMLISLGNRLIVRRVQVRLDGEILLIPENKIYESELLSSGADRNDTCDGCQLSEHCTPTFVGSIVGRILFNR